MEENKQSSSRLIGLTLAATTGIFLLLELWRPYFFLTDDNLDCTLCFYVEVGRHLLAGQSPFVSEHIFGGHYHYLRDMTYLGWHPFYLVVSLLAGTPWRYAIVDIVALLFFLLAAAGFVRLAEQLRRELTLDISDGWIMFYALSFTYSSIAITTGSSWLNFLGVHSALPWLALGILWPEWRKGTGLVFLSVLSLVLGGHVTVVVSGTLILSLFSVGVALWRKSWKPLAAWALGYAAAVVLLLPILVPEVNGFLDTTRSHGVPLDDMNLHNIPLGYFPASLFAGTALWMTHPHEAPVYVSYTYMLAACAAAWCIVPALTCRAKWRGLDLVTLLLVMVVMTLVCRPVWISEVMLRLPLLRATRYPFRELLDFQLFFHLFLLLRTPTCAAWFRRGTAIFSASIMVIPLFSNPLPPTLNALPWDRRILLSGGFDQYWSQVRPLLAPGDRVAVIIPLDYFLKDRFHEPYPLLGTHDYAMLAGFTNVWGWTQTYPISEVKVHTYPIYQIGAYRPEQREQLLAGDPDLKIITLESVQPLRITLSSLHGPVIDLTPFVPPALRQP